MSSETNIYNMKNQNKKNIYQKLHAACIKAGGVKKADKVSGMRFNPLLHDAVQETATQALLDQGLYVTCNYLTETVESRNMVMCVCTMRVHDIDDPKSFIIVDGCSALGKMDQFGTGNAMSYSRKYAFLNLLNLKTGIKDESGYEPTSFEKNSPEKSVEEPTYLDDEVNVEDIIKDISDTTTARQLSAVKDLVRDQVMYLKKNNLKAFEQVMKHTREHEVKLNNNQQ
tara:strand:+ start:36 stop:716 length:681 start_codon:yes stop_codon:yes gene_type:complete